MGWDDPEPAHSVQTSPKMGRPPLVSKLFLALGSISVFNVFANYQNLIDFSNSIHWIARWWRYIISVPFSWLQLELTDYQREAIVLLTFFTTAASYALYKEIGINVLRVWLIVLKGRVELSDPRFTAQAFERNSLNTLPSITAAVAILISSTGLIFIAVNVPAMRLPRFIIYIIPIIMIVVMTSVFIAERPSPKIWRKVFAVIVKVFTFPFAVAINWLFILMSYSKEILSSLFLLILVLIFDIAARYTLDPLLSAYPTLPEPPTLSMGGEHAVSMPTGGMGEISNRWSASSRHA